jgi:Zn-dependent protease with chaperone function
MAERKILTQISPTAWEHPADRAALNTLRALPGFDEVVRKIMGLIGERGIRHLFLANAVRVGPRQRPKLDALYTEVLETLDYPDRPDLYVTQTPFVNAMAVGFEKPFIVLNSGTLGLLSREGQRDIIGHEMGHIMSGHTTYTTIAIIVLTLGVQNLPFLAGLALLPFQLALLEWYRKAELSCDRAALLTTQDPEASLTVFLKMAGGAAGDDEIDLDAFLAQAAEYETDDNIWDKTLKLLNTLQRDHPFATVRAGELQRWIQSGAYERILSGDYPRRGDPGSQRPLSEDYAEAAGYYGQHARETINQTVSTLGGMFDRARDAFNQTKRGPNGGADL